MVRDFKNFKSRGRIGRPQAVSIPSDLRCSQSPGDQKGKSFVRTVHNADGLDIPTLKWFSFILSSMVELSGWST